MEQSQTCVLYAEPIFFVEHNDNIWNIIWFNFEIWYALTLCINYKLRLWFNRTKVPKILWTWVNFGILCREDWIPRTDIKWFECCNCMLMIDSDLFRYPSSSLLILHSLTLNALNLKIMQLLQIVFVFL